jgi:lactam utilization protein B
VHGDNPKALEFVKALRESLVEHGMKVKAFA